MTEMRKKSFKAESKRLLDLMINSIYTHKEIFLREIISNASDALDKLHFVSLTDEKARAFADNLAIEIYADKENRTLTVSDNGIGMTEKSLKKTLERLREAAPSSLSRSLQRRIKTTLSDSSASASIRRLWFPAM